MPMELPIKEAKHIVSIIVIGTLFLIMEALKFLDTNLITRIHSTSSQTMLIPTKGRITKERDITEIISFWRSFPSPCAGQYV